MGRKILSLMAAFLGLAANTVSALSAPFSRYAPDEIDRLKERLMSKPHTNGAVLLLPKPRLRFEKFLWLAAHGSHASHASHASHVSHASGTSHKSGSSCSVYTPIPPVLSSNMIPGFKDTKLVGKKNFPFILYLPPSTLEYPTLEYKVKNPPLNGTLEINSDGKIIYIPNPGFVSNDRFSVVASDGITVTEPVFFDIDVKLK
jgi:hypothetical protein